MDSDEFKLRSPEKTRMSSHNAVTSPSSRFTPQESRIYYVKITVARQRLVITWEYLGHACSITFGPKDRQRPTKSTSHGRFVAQRRWITAIVITIFSSALESHVVHPQRLYRALVKYFNNCAKCALLRHRAYSPDNAVERPEISPKSRLWFRFNECRIFSFSVVLFKSLICWLTSSSILQLG